MFLADCQLGAYASFSGLTDQDVVEYAAGDLRVKAAPKTDSIEWDATRYEAAIRIANHLRPEFVVMGYSTGGDVRFTQDKTETRQLVLNALDGGEFDVVIIGGGITGVGCALDAASRGLSVALLEQRDLGSGTSSRSSKLIHGGLRYLEQLHFGLVREALHEHPPTHRAVGELVKEIDTTLIHGFLDFFRQGDIFQCKT